HGARPQSCAGALLRRVHPGWWPAMTGAPPEARLAHQPRGRIRADLVYLGWQQAAAQPDPGPMPHPPAETELDDVSADWLAAQRRERRRLARPAPLGATAGAGAGGAGGR